MKLGIGQRRGSVPIQRLKGDLKRATAILNRARAKGDDLTSDLEQAVLAAQRLLAAAVALSSPIRRGRIEQKVSRQGAEAATLPMYERLYCAPADIPDHRTQYYIGNRDAGTPDAPTEPIHQSNCQIERTGTDIAAAVRMETGRQLQFKVGHTGGHRKRDRSRYAWFVSVSLNTRPLQSDDTFPPKPLYDGVSEELSITRWALESDFYLSMGMSVARSSDLSNSRMHLAMEYGFNVDTPHVLVFNVSSDDPRELRCDDRGHIEALDRWTQAEW